MKEPTQQNAEQAAEDETIIRDVLAGNINAFALLERKYRRIVSFLIRKMIRNDEDVEDLVQDTFVKAYAALPSFQFEYPFSRWLYKIASNRCIDHLRKRRFHQVSLDEPISTRDGGDLYMDPPDREQTPDVALLARERFTLLKEALETMPDKYREVIRLRHEEELEYQEIADRLHQPLGTVKAHLFRARKLLYKKLLKHGSHFEEYMADEGNE
ncbi:MAG: sigma-70 family RNA polymerase sigma factor [Candidatus Kapabacteria bacterium]|jgi:RNA polymerase sigma-70 factor (ECF subfamily)|nr:sigma-70 family RNA polymerase sigma factor [Candidatus Kapabacteria bacterium]